MKEDGDEDRNSHVCGGGQYRHTGYTEMPHIVTVPEQITDTKRYEHSPIIVR